MVELVDQGLVVEHQMEANESEFSVNAAREDEIVRLVETNA